MLAIRGLGGCGIRAVSTVEWSPSHTAASEARLSAPAQPTSRDRRRWARYLVNERAEAHVYRELAARREGEERDILLALVDAEGRHEAHWLELLGGEPAALPRPDAGTVLLGWLAKRFGSIFVLALAQNAEARSPYETEPFATPAMAADEKIHHEVVRGLAARGRRRLSGTFRAAVFGANDGLVSNLALVMGVGATGVSPQFVLFSGIAGLLAGALSMGAGEFVSVRSQRELLEATEPNNFADSVLPDLDLDANELALVYRTRGMPAADALERARSIVAAAQEADRSRPYRRPSEIDRRPRGGRQRLARRAVELPVLRVGRDHPGAAVDLRALGSRGGHHGARARRHRPPGDRGRRRAALGRSAAAPRAASAGDRLRRGGDHLPARACSSASRWGDVPDS